MAPVYLLFGAFFIMMFAGVPIAASLGLAGVMAIALGKLGIMAFPTNFYAGIAKYPLLAIPMFVLAGAIFDRAGVAARLLTFAQAIIGRGRGSLAVITILVAMIVGGISGSGPACTAAVGGVMIAAMMRNGYPPAFAASVTAAAGSTDILIPPSVAFVVYSVLVPSATVPANRSMVAPSAATKTGGASIPGTPAMSSGANALVVTRSPVLRAASPWSNGTSDARYSFM